MNYLKIYTRIAGAIFCLFLCNLNEIKGQACATSNEVIITVVPDLSIQTQPQPITECIGGILSMNVVLTAGTGTGTISYLWEQSANGTSGWTPATGATNSASYTPPSSTTGTIYYRATISATGVGCGLVTSNIAQVTIIDDLSIQTQPQPITECVGGSLTMSVVATAGSGTGTLSYAWEQSTTGTGGWTAATGGTNSATYTPPSGTAGVMYYRIVISASGNGCGSVTSNNATATVIPDLTIQTQPQPITECVGGSLTMSVVATAGTGTGTISYAWEESTTGTGGWIAATGGTNSATYTPPSGTAGTMYYRAIISASGNGCGSVTSANATATIIGDLTIQTQAQPITECVGGSLTMSVAITAGTGTISYTWEESTTGTGGWIAATGGTNSATYTPPSGTAGTMYYRAIISASGNGCGSVTSANATATIIGDLTIQTQAQPITECVGGSLTMSVVATAGSGSGTLSYAWEQSSTGTGGWTAATGGINSATYTPPSGTAGVMYYRVVISASGNGCGSVTSNNATATVIRDLTIETEPQPITECVGGSLTMSVVATAGTGTGTISYTWEESTTGTGGWIAATGGTNSATYTPPSGTAGTMYYRAIISASGNGCGSVTSVPAAAIIIPDLTIATQLINITECLDGVLPLTVVATGGTGTGTLSYVWEQSTTGTGGWTAAIGATNSPTYIPTSTTAGTMYYRATISATGNGCGSVISNVATVVIVAKPAVLVTTPDQTICIGGALTLNANVSGGTGTCTIQWQESVNSAPYIDINGANNPTFFTNALLANTKYRATFSCNGNGCCN